MWRTSFRLRLLLLLSGVALLVLLGSLRRSRSAASSSTAAATPVSRAGYATPVALQLQLPKSVVDDPLLNNRDATFRQYGFNLKRSNALPLAHDVPDLRSDECKALQYPKNMPQASVIIIFYNEPLSTLLRNVVSVLNRTPQELLGEIVMVDDNSTLAELAYLPQHLEQLPPGMVRLVHRNVHDGIVGARVRGAKEARYPVLVFLDSHSEVSAGWLEPLLARIHEDPTRVVVPQIRGISLETFEHTPGDLWPPAKGSFNWRLTFTIVDADPSRDLIGDGPRKTRPVASPVMPGGLFAIDRAFFFKLGAYDPEIKYYGAEHVELSFRVWMCGGSMEGIPCSNVGHIYRNFDRFGVDPQLKHINVGTYLDRNDMRVAEVWMDEYKKLFYDFRHLAGKPFGDVSDRRRVREENKCKSFKWYLDHVAYDVYIPDMHGRPGRLAAEDDSVCLSSGNVEYEGNPVLQACAPHNDHQQWVYTEDNYIQLNHYPKHELLCLHLESVALVSCATAPVWSARGTSLHLEGDEQHRDQCLERAPGNKLRIRDCVNKLASQEWHFHKSGKSDDEGFSMESADSGHCLDNMQHARGPPGLYGCHHGGTQRWKLTREGRVASAMTPDACLGFQYSVKQMACQKDDDDFRWIAENAMFKPKRAAHLCLHRSHEHDLILEPCDTTAVVQRWKFSPVGS